MKVNHFLIRVFLLFICFTIPAYTMAYQSKAEVKISETDNIYNFRAKYDQAKTKKIQELMSESLKDTGFSFTNTQMDANLALTGGINFYIKSYAGELVLKFDKRKNNPNDYTKFKKMCEGIKTIVQQD
jgi:hypothetical protein